MLWWEPAPERLRPAVIDVLLTNHDYDSCHDYDYDPYNYDRHDYDYGNDYDYYDYDCHDYDHDYKLFTIVMIIVNTNIIIKSPERIKPSLRL